MNTILVVVGPTSSGKSELAVQLARQFGGEIISADSRQIYKGMDLGTGKIPGRWVSTLVSGRTLVSLYVYKKIRHHLIDFANPKKQYSVAQFKDAAQKIIADILKRGKLPILCGGTAHWIDAVVYNQNIPNVAPNLKLRAKLEKKSTEDLYRQLQKLDPQRAKTIDRKNPRRLIRALEIIITTGKPVPLPQPPHADYRTLWVGILVPEKVLFAKIEKRLKLRLKQGMLHEIENLHKHGVSWKRLEQFGLEYKFGALYLQKKLSYDKMFAQLLLAIRHYSKRQLTWWKKNKEIQWISKPPEAKKLVEKFLK